MMGKRNGKKRSIFGVLVSLQSLEIARNTETGRAGGMSSGPVRRGRFSIKFDNPYYLCKRDGNLIGEGILGGDGNS
jgi:hypothetical protein